MYIAFYARLKLSNFMGAIHKIKPGYSIVPPKSADRKEVIKYLYDVFGKLAEFADARHLDSVVKVEDDNFFFMCPVVFSDNRGISLSDPYSISTIATDIIRSGDYESILSSLFLFGVAHNSRMNASNERVTYYAIDPVFSEAMGMLAGFANVGVCVKEVGTRSELKRYYISDSRINEVLHVSDPRYRDAVFTVKEGKYGNEYLISMTKISLLDTINSPSQLQIVSVGEKPVDGVDTVSFSSHSFALSGNNLKAGRSVMPEICHTSKKISDISSMFRNNLPYFFHPLYDASKQWQLEMQSMQFLSLMLSLRQDVSFSFEKVFQPIPVLMNHVVPVFENVPTVHIPYTLPLYREDYSGKTIGDAIVKGKQIHFK